MQILFAFVDLSIPQVTLEGVVFFVNLTYPLVNRAELYNSDEILYEKNNEVIMKPGSKLFPTNQIKINNKTLTVRYRSDNQFEFSYSDNYFNGKICYIIVKAHLWKAFIKS